MLTRFDHAVIAVRSLDDSLVHWRERLGFDARPGGHHTGRGTHNGIVRFGLDYLELISVYDRAQLEARMEPNALALARELDARGDGLIGFALATDDIVADATDLQKAGLPVIGPAAMERRRPDGVLLKWRLLVPEGGSWCRPLPFIIQWDVADDERLALDPPGNHVNGATALVELAIVVADLDVSAALYGRFPGLRLVARDEVEALAAHRARFRVGSTVLDLLSPSGAGEVAAALEERGERPWQLTIAVADLEAAAAFLEARGAALSPAPGSSSGLLLSPQSAPGTRIVLVPDGARTRRTA
jgi:catechol 2,3-dioxygenase-like lactoylglutathione lyase family enzyme